MTISDESTYQSAWNEAMRRVVVRDQLVIGYVGAAGALIIAGRQSHELALAVPFLTFLAGGMIGHHDYMISRFNRYLQGFQAEEAGTKLWHSNSLKWPVRIGACLYTLPILTIFVGYSFFALNFVSEIKPGEYVKTRFCAPLATLLGISFLVFGRMSQFSALKRGKIATPIVPARESSDKGDIKKS